MKKLLLLTLTSLLILGGCSKEQISVTKEKTITIVDQIGRTVELEEEAEEIVSSYYISSAILVALGLEDNITGIEAKTETRELYKQAAPDLIDLPQIGSGKGISIEEIAELNPDLVIIPKKLSDSVESLESLDIKVIVVDPETLDNFKECISILATATGKEEEGEKLLTYYDEKIEEISALTSDLENKPTVYLSAGSDYLSTCTSQMYQNDLIAMAGGTNVSSELTDGYWQTISAEELNVWNPEYIFAVSYAEYTLDDIKNSDALSEISAIKNENVYSFPSNIEPWDYPTPSSVLGILYLTHVLHPDIYTEADYIEEANYFYKEFFDIEVTQEDLGL